MAGVHTRIDNVVSAAGEDTDTLFSRLQKLEDMVAKIVSPTPLDGTVAMRLAAALNRIEGHTFGAVTKFFD